MRNLTNFGLFIELEEGIDGLVHVSDLSWTRKIKHPSEFVKVGEEMEVMVLELDVENRKLSLSHKHLEENPWDTFEEVFNAGSTHKCTVIQKNEKSAILELPYGIEGIATSRHIEKEDGTQVEVGEALDFQVLEFSKSDRRILLSHTKTWKEEEKSAEVPSGDKRKKPGPRKSAGSNKAINKINKEVEKSTLGDLSALAALKEQMDGDDKSSK